MYGIQTDNYAFALHGKGNISGMHEVTRYATFNLSNNKTLLFDRKAEGAETVKYKYSACDSTVNLECTLSN